MLERRIMELEEILCQDDKNNRKFKKAIKNILRQFTKDIKFKEIDERFLSDVLERHPHWIRKVDGLAGDYLQLLVDLSYIFKEQEQDKQNKLKHWISRLRRCQHHEICLIFDSHNLELGSDPG